MAGVRVQAQRYVYQAGGARRLVTAGTPSSSAPTTDDLGQYRIYGLMPGAYLVSAVPQTIGSLGITLPDGPVTSISAPTDGNNTSDGYTTTYFPGTANPEDAQTITVSLGQEAAATFAMTSAKFARISGFIRNSQGSSAGRMMVMMRTDDGTGMSMMAGMSQADGSFAFGNLAPGEHVIDVRSFPTGMGAMLGGPSQGTEDESATVTVPVNGQDVTGLIITTGPGATISGRLVFDGASARPQAPAQPFRVAATGLNPAVPNMSTTMDNGVVDESGNFRLRGVSGPVLFRASVPGWDVKSVKLNGVDITDTAYDAKPSTTITGLEITVTDRQTTLSGVAKNIRGDAVKDFVVVVFPQVPKEGLLGARFTRAIRPDQDGRYQTKGLPPGDYVAVAVESLEQGSEWDPAFQQLMKPRGKTVRLMEGQSTTLDLTLAP